MNLFFYKTESFQVWESTLALCWRWVEDRAVFTDFHPLCRSPLGQPRFLLGGQLLPRLRAISQMQVLLGEAQLYLTDGLHLLTLKTEVTGASAFRSRIIVTVSGSCSFRNALTTRAGARPGAKPGEQRKAPSTGDTAQLCHGPHRPGSLWEGRALDAGRPRATPTHREPERMNGTSQVRLPAANRTPERFSAEKTNYNFAYKSDRKLQLK